MTDKLRKNEKIKNVHVTALSSDRYYVTTIFTNEGRILQRSNGNDKWEDITPKRDGT